MNEIFLLLGEVRRPHRTLVQVGLALIVVTFIINVMQFIISLDVDSNLHHYRAGYFNTLADKMAGEWLKHFMMCGAYSQ